MMAGLAMLLVTGRWHFERSKTQLEMTDKPFQGCHMKHYQWRGEYEEAERA